MIDWISCRLPCENVGQIDGGQVISITPDGEIEWESQKRLSVPGSHESSITVRSYGVGLIEFDGNPAKWLQGHNCFGTDDLIGLVYEAMMRLVKLLNLDPSPSDIHAWSSGDYVLTRVDCTAMWELPTRADVRAVIRALELQAKSRHGRAITSKGTVYFGKNSRRWSLKFYAKADELEDRGKGHRLPWNLPERDKLKAWVENKLRGELTLRGMQLKKTGIECAKSWTDILPLELLQRHLDTLDMPDQVTLTTEVLDDLPARLQAVYKLWKQGEDIRAMYKRPTFYRYRRELLKRGIDIAILQPSQKTNVIPFVRVLRPEAIAQVPDWAIGTALYFEPAKIIK